MLNEEDDIYSAITMPCERLIEEVMEPTKPQRLMLSNEQQQLVDEFSSFLLNEQELAESVTDSVDLFSLFCEIEALKNEVKLESRQIKNTLDDYKELIGLLKSNNVLLSQQLTEQHDFYLRLKEQDRRSMAEELIAFCDYLTLSLDTMRQSYKVSWLFRRSKSNKMMMGMLEGQAMLLSRFNTILKGIDVRPMPVIGTAFDSARMCVGGVCVRSDLPNGFVESELKKGYFIGNSVLRLAEVIVNKLNEETL